MACGCDGLGASYGPSLPRGKWTGTLFKHPTIQGRWVWHIYKDGRFVHSGSIHQKYGATRKDAEEAMKAEVRSYAQQWVG